MGGGGAQTVQEDPSVIMVQCGPTTVDIITQESPVQPLSC